MSVRQTVPAMLATMLVLLLRVVDVAALPPRPDNAGGDAGGSGSAQPGQIALYTGTDAVWTVVQWTDARTWHDVEGWRGQPRNGWIVWGVAAADLGTGPFRWAVYDSPARVIELGVSREFNLPVQPGDVVELGVSLATPTATATATPTPRPRPSATSTTTATASHTPTQTPSPTATSTATPSPAPTATRAPTPIATPTMTPPAPEESRGIPWSTLLSVAAPLAGAAGGGVAYLLRRSALANGGAPPQSRYWVRQGKLRDRKWE